MATVTILIVVVLVPQKELGVIIALHDQAFSLGPFVSLIIGPLLHHELHLDEILPELLKLIVFTHYELFVCEDIERETVRCLQRLV